MYPELFQIGPFTLRSFGLMAALGFLAAYAALRRFSLRLARMAPDDASALLVAAMVGGALGARLAYVAEHWSAEFAAGPLLEVLRFDRGGLMFYGGLGGAIAAILVLALAWRRNPADLLDLGALALPLGHALGRVGCFLNGCCYGRVSRGVLSVCYPAGSEPWRAQVADGL
ncbi:MAG: prolipoprotein diacylglyceryl transferase, partial [Kiritimatiellae bacterium]|nr:prolipoprotein diacylglyceryl transferase [Kiritimatiellia bacterium]